MCQQSMFSVSGAGSGKNVPELEPPQNRPALKPGADAVKGRPGAGACKKVAIPQHYVEVLFFRNY